MKSRTLAQALIATGHVRIDGKRVEKPSDEVRVDSVVALPDRRGPPAEARAAYEEIDEGQPAT